MASKWLIRLGLATALALCGYWIYNAQTPADEVRFAFALHHPFNDPVIYFPGTGLRFEKDRTDARRLNIHFPPQDLSTPKYLLVEDGELDYLGFVKKDQVFIPLELFQIHDDRPGQPPAPVTDCKTYLEIQANVDTILVLVDSQYVLRGVKTGPNMYVIPFCETTREHQFQTIGLHGIIAGKNPAPSTYAFAGLGATGSQPKGNFNYRLRYAGDTIRMAGPMMYQTAGNAQPQALPAEHKTANTKVIVSLPRRVESPWVFLNDKRLKDFTLNSTRNQLTFYVHQSDQPIRVRVGDNNCECQASGYPRHSTLELAAYCECRDIQVTVQLDPGVDRYRNKIRVYIDGQLTDITLPPAGQPFTFPVRKTNQDQQVALKLILVDDSGRSGMIELCNFTVPQEVTTANISPTCHCSDCPPNIKISG